VEAVFLGFGMGRGFDGLNGFTRIFFRETRPLYRVISEM